MGRLVERIGRPPSGDRFGALGERDFRLLYIGRVVSITGDKVAPVALAFAVLGLTDSAVDLGYVLSARVVAMVVFLLVGGVWADRLPRRATLIGTDLLRFATQGLTAILLLAGWAEVWQLIVLQAIAGAGQAFFRPASTGLIPDTVSRARLQQANALLGMSEHATTIFGPAIAAAIVATVGPGWAIGLDALTYAVSALFLVRLRVDESRRRRPRGTFVADLGEGWAEFRSRRWLVALVGEYALYHLAVFAPFYVLGPTLAARDLGGAAAWGVIMTAFGAGAIAGGVAGLRLQPTRPLLVVAALFALHALPLVALALTDIVALIGATTFLAGVTSAFAAAIWETTLQERVPAEALSRVSSYDWLGSMAFLPLGYALVGPLAEWLGVEAVLIVGAALQLASVPVLLAMSSIRETPRRRGSSRAGRSAGQLLDQG
jgi:predicted MFS family arabinose efflux permease